MQSKYENFEVNKVPLTGRNLVEASAGTGKTYSIAILVLRMLVERNIPIEQQLVVTFTNFAVAELKERIRHFIKQAYDATAFALNHDNSFENCSIDATIVAICQGQDNLPALKDTLRAALINIDEASILTIHGFAQKMLQQFAFETKQSFAANLQNDTDTFIAEATHHFWRTTLSQLEPNLFSPEELIEIKKNCGLILRKALAEVPFVYESEIELSEATEQFKTELLTARTSLSETLNELRTLHSSEVETILEDAQSGAHAKKAILPIAESAELLLNLIWTKYIIPDVKFPQYYSKFNSIFWETSERLRPLSEAIKVSKTKLQAALLYQAQQTLLPKLKQEIEQAQILTFDALILNLHKVIVKENNEPLIDLIREKYPVAFIDECQDTDAIQFSMFEQLFIDSSKKRPNPTTLFMIGDPKQSIYAFRNADVESYLVAQKRMDTKYSMNTNYRSSANMIAANNDFFGASGAEVFGFPESETNGIRYHEVQAKPDQKKQILRRGIPMNESLLFSAHANAEGCTSFLPNTILDLLNEENDFRIDEGNGIVRTILPQDIAVLVTSKFDGMTIKEELHALHIPAVSIDDRTVLKSEAANDLSIILEAMLTPRLREVKAALYLTFLNKIYAKRTGHNLPVNEMDELSIIEFFTSYQQICHEETVFQAIQKLLADFSVQTVFSGSYADQRTLADINQLAELLHQIQYKKELSASEINLWLKRAINSEEQKNDEYATQIESDDHAVNILTIHKSKGLEFLIVFVYGVGKSPRKNDTFNEVKLPEDGRRVLKSEHQISEIEKEILDTKAAQEKLRLIYVALTRAVYQTYVFYAKGSHSKFEKSMLFPLVSQTGISEKYIDLNFSGYPDCVESKHYTQKIKRQKLSPFTFNESIAETSRSNWAVLSYSALSLPHEFEPKLNDKNLESYDHFIYNQLSRGAETGSKLHELFEHINFAKNYTEPTLLNELDKLQLVKFNTKTNKTVQDFSSHIAQLIKHVMEARISFPQQEFNLKEISIERKMHELEFDFVLSQSQVHQKIKPLLQEYKAGFQDKYFQLNGMMTGFIDLLFEHNGQFFILDWKSNYLGFEQKDYEENSLREAMETHQYTLQYLIYTVAVHKFLQQRLGDQYDYNVHFGGIIYVFLRGCRAGTQTGIYTDRPSKEYIEALSEAFNGQ